MNIPDTLAVSNIATNHIDLLNLLNVLKWPVVVIIIALIFRKTMINFINRISKIGHGKTSVEALQQPSGEKQEQVQISLVDRALGLFRPETTALVRSAVLQESDLSKISGDKERIEHLIKYSSAIYIIKHFDQIYYSIYGSQLMILQQLNTDAVEDNSSLKRYYDYAAGQNPTLFAEYSYEDYLAYLISFNLIIKEGNQIKITILGVDFLKYLSETSKSFTKRN
jgi:hypothetical protein